MNTVNKDNGTRVVSGIANNRETLFKVTVFVLLFFSLYLIYLVFTPFLHVLILAIVFSGVLYPLYLRTLRVCKYSSLSSFLVVLSLVLCVILPVSVLCVMLIPEAVTIIARIQDFLVQNQITSILSPDIINNIQDITHRYLPFVEFNEDSLKADLLSLSKATGQLLFTTATATVKNILYLITQFLLFIGIIFFLLRDGRSMLIRLRELFPLPSRSFERITQSLRRVSRAVFIGGFMVAIVQACFVAIGFWIIGYPSVLGSFAAGFASLIPILGTGLVWIPFSLYLFSIGDTNSALIFLAWNVIVVTNIDSFLRPYFMSGNVGASVLFIFLSILGGIAIFGMLGIFYGPLILAFLLVMLDIYGEEYSAILHGKDTIK